MKEYRVYETQRSREAHVCTACDREIAKGDPCKFVEPTAGNKTFWCNSCPVDQSLIGKNVQNGKVRELVVAKTKGQTKQVASLITEEKASTPGELLSEEDKKLITETEEIEQESTDILGKNGDIPKAYCTKCKRNHIVGSRRYERHIAFIKKS
jgi:hypothetical protein